MRYVLILFSLLLTANAFAATIYVSTTGNDTTGTGAFGSPYATIGKAHTVASNGDVIELAAGTYAEHTAITKSITLLSTVPGMASTKHVRLQTSNVKLDGVKFEGFSDQTRAYGQSLNANVRIETAAANIVITNCVFTNAVYAVGTNFSFISGTITNAIYNPTIDFRARGFGTNSHIYLGASGMTNKYFAEHNTEWLVHSISGDGHTMFVTNDTARSFAVDTGTNYFAAISAGNGSEVLYSIYGVVTSGAYPTNVTIVNCTFDGIFGAPFYAYFNGATITNNYVGMHFGYRTIALQGRNMEIAYNQFMRYRSYLRYTQQEIQNLVHPPGADWFDDASSEISAFEDTLTSTNNSFHHNYCVDWNNQMGLADPRAPSATNEISGLYITNNVFVGITEHFSGGRNDMWVMNNTYYKCAYEFGEGHALTLGSGGSGSTPVTNLIIARNVFIDCGDHSGGTNFGNDRGFYTVSTNAISPIVGSNWVAAAEVLQYQGKTTFTETNGVNGGDPTFQNPENPLGEDGIPWTNDDGLRPVPGSRLALLGWGALSAPTNTAPVANFRITSINTWLDDNTTNYNPAWVALNPWDRAPLGAERQYQTPDAIGRVPCDVTLTLTNTFDGYLQGFQNIIGWSVNWGDGSVVVAATGPMRGKHPATASHTFVQEGTNIVTLTVTNINGDVDTFARSYRVLPRIPSATNRVIYVDSVNGNNSNNGTSSWASAWSTLTKAITNAASTDIIAARGNWAEWTDVLAGKTNIKFLSYGARTGGFKIRDNDITIDGWFITYTNVPDNSGSVYIYNNVLRPKVINCYVNDYNTDLSTGFRESQFIYHVTSTASTNRVAFGFYSNNIVDSINNIIFDLNGWSNRVCYNEVKFCNGQADFVRPHGDTMWIHDNYYHDNSLLLEKHTDTMQVFGYDQGTNAVPDTAQYVYARNIYMYNNFFSNNVCQIGQFETKDNPTNQMTNIWIVNNIYYNIAGQGNDSVNGLKFANNGFYKTCTSIGQILTGAGIKGSAWGSWMTNCIMWLCGSDTNNNTFGWYSAKEEFVSTNGNFSADYNAVFPVKRLPPPTNNFQRWGSWPNTAETHGLNGNAPQFLNETDGFFLISTNSPYATNGYNMTADWQANGLPIVDFFNRPRSTTGTWSIGPMESGLALDSGSGGDGGSTNDIIRHIFNGGIIIQGGVVF